MAQATNGLANGLTALAAGDLAFQIEERFAADFEDLRQNFNVAVRQLSQTLAAVSLAADSIDGGSREIANSADDLSKRTERQAAALEETAAALDQITANVTSSSRRAEEARTAASQANADAARSGEVWPRRCCDMRRIEAASGNISNIIGVIDEIAFRPICWHSMPGSRRRVRGMPARASPSSPRRSRELAHARRPPPRRSRRSSSPTPGSLPWREAGLGNRIGTEHDPRLHRRINQHMDAIATSAREQSMGLSEVNTAVNQMDQTTQQNAAMVEEASAASATLAAESAKMRGLINQFHLGRSASPAPTRPTMPDPPPHARHRNGPLRPATPRLPGIGRNSERIDQTSSST